MLHFRHVLRIGPAASALSIATVLLTGCGSSGPAPAALTGAAATSTPSGSAHAVGPQDVARAAAGTAAVPLAKSVAARRIVLASMTKPEPRGPYRMTIVAGPGTSIIWDVVPPSSRYTSVTSPEFGRLETIQIGKRWWTAADGVWKQDPAVKDDPSAGGLSFGKMSAKDLVSATEKPSTDRKIRLFTAVIRSTPKHRTATVRIDRGTGRLLSMAMYDPAKRTTVTLTIRYDAKIKITAPEV